MELFSAKGVVVHCARRQLYQFLSFGELYNINGLKTVFLDTAKHYLPIMIGSVVTQET